MAFKNIFESPQTGAIPTRRHAACYLSGPMQRTGRRVFCSTVLALVAVPGCLSPTLPLPPPERPEVTGPDPETGEVRLRGTVPAKAQVHAINLRTFDIRGQVVGVDGAYDFALPAEIGDEVSMYYRKGTTESQSIVFAIRDPNAQ